MPPEPTPETGYVWTAAKVAPPQQLSGADPVPTKYAVRLTESVKIMDGAAGMAVAAGPTTLPPASIFARTTCVPAKPAEADM